MTLQERILAAAEISKKAKVTKIRVGKKPKSKPIPRKKRTPEERDAWYKDYYQRNKEELKAKQKAYRQRKKNV